MLKKFLIHPNKNLRIALKLISKNGCKAIAVCKNGFFLGTLSDGDIRKAILNGHDLDSKVFKFYNKNSVSLIKNNYSLLNAKNLFVKNNFDIIPIVDTNKKIIEVLTWKNIFSSEKKIKKQTIPVIIMAGGKGKRLLPITSILPKPLVPIKGKPVIDHIIETFVNAGFGNFKFVINYYSQLIEAYLKNKKFKNKFSFYTEKIPLGTIGGVKKLRINKNNFFVTNCDVIFKIDYEDLIRFHTEGKKDLTIVTCHKNYQIPYGVCNLDERGNLSHINEKPEYDFLVNSGLYLIKKSIISLIPSNSKFDFTDLVNICIKNKKTIGVYPVSENQWIDIGQWEEYRKALDSL